MLRKLSKADFCWDHEAAPLVYKREVKKSEKRRKKQMAPSIAHVLIKEYTPDIPGHDFFEWSRCVLRAEKPNFGQLIGVCRVQLQLQ